MNKVIVKERPILFSGAMVRALLAGTKNQTRRKLKHEHFAKHLGSSPLDVAAYVAQHDMKPFCPYGKPGDRLWVREAWFPMRYDWKELGSAAPILYSDGEIANRAKWGEAYNGTRPPMGWAWKSPIHMPRAASRILLEITDVRCERLQDISEDDAVVEGVEVVDTLNGQPLHYYDYVSNTPAWSSLRLGPAVQMTAKGSYETLWESINGPGSWAANPWVWVVGFKVLDGKEATRA
jgi:hypothetical protein